MVSPRGWKTALMILGAVPSLASQPRVRAPNGVLSGAIRDSLTSRPVGYALATLVEKSQSQFANDAGRFRFDGVRPGPITIRVQQIGYRPIDVGAVVVDDPSSPDQLELVISREELRLPEIVVVGDRSSCAPGLAAASGTGAIINRVRSNVDRLRVLERNYPFEINFDHTSAILDSTGVVLGKALRRTYTYSTKQLVGYQVGKVADRAGRVTLFTASDVARDEFQRHHCFWYDGADTVSGRLEHRIAFAPISSVHSVDWTGTLSIDAATAVLRHSDVRLANVGPRSPILGSNCGIEYGEIAPTLVLEQKASCWTVNRDRPTTTVFDVRQFLSHRFLKRKPGDP